MKHVNYSFHQNTNTVIPIESNFYKHNQEHFPFLFPMDEFSAMQGFVLVSQRLVLLEDESPPYLPLRMEFSADPPPISKSSNAVGEKGVSIPGLKTAFTASWSISQWNSTSSRSVETWYPLVSKPCAPTPESTSSLISSVPCWLRETGTRARWLFKNRCLWDNNKLQAARGIFWVNCQFMGEIFYSQSRWTWSKVERPINTVVGGWEKHVAFM